MVFVGFLLQMENILTINQPRSCPSVPCCILMEYAMTSTKGIAAAPCFLKTLNVFPQIE